MSAPFIWVVVFVATFLILVVVIGLILDGVDTYDVDLERQQQKQREGRGAAPELPRGD